MTPKDLSSLLTLAFKQKLKVLIKGAPGVGKSDIVAQAAQAAGCHLLISHPAISDPTDYKGMPAIVNGGEHAEFLPFGDLRQLIEAIEPTVCFLDDIGQAPHAVQAALMQLILARRVNGHEISEHVIFCGATNDSSHRAGVHGLLEPVKSRWDTIVELEAHLDSWCEWAYASSQPVELIAFLRFRPALLSKFEPSKELTNSPSPRTAAAVGRWVKAGLDQPLLHTVIEGAAGSGFAAEFMAFYGVWQSMPNIDAILLNPKAAGVPTEPATMYAVTGALIQRAEKGNLGRVLTYMARMPKEFEVFGMKDIMRKDATLANTREFSEWAVRNSSLLN